MSTHLRNTILLATDQQRSVLSALNAHGPHPIAYTAYGHRPAENGLLSLLGFNGEPPDPLTGHYHLGNGYRQFNPVLMRFNSPDSLSPFGEGGLNAYGYCGGSPIMRTDRTGHKYNLIKGIANFFGRERSAISTEIKEISDLLKTFKNTEQKISKAINKRDYYVSHGEKILKNEQQTRMQIIKNHELANLEAPEGKKTKLNMPPPSFIQSVVGERVEKIEKSIESLQEVISMSAQLKDQLKHLKEMKRKGKTLNNITSAIRQEIKADRI